MPRNDLTLSSKIALLDKIKIQPLNTSYCRLAEITGVPKSTISRVYDKKVNNVRNWYYKKDNGKCVNINDPILKPKSEEYDIKLGRNDFKETDGWLSQWKARHNIKFKKAHGEKGSGDNESAEQ
ncbi:hypothetical protein RF11_09168 [Thelohanellus kitauei]|uniref:HTH CENPB-type domain-containing protein n=1 Tax=Thelohanellus kitauei TaxID=669202 RepID=A0A0C2J051_THEKT|nr:hypothetical protein RF11_09168 [Thelohanellus kitauei]